MHITELKAKAVAIVTTSERVNVYLFLLSDVRDGDACGRIFVDRRRTQSACYYASKTEQRLNMPVAPRPADRLDEVWRRSHLSAERETFVRRRTRARATGAKRMQIITRYSATETYRRHRSLCGHGTPMRRRLVPAARPTRPSISIAAGAVVFGS